MSTGWILLSLFGPPVAAAIAGTAFRSRDPGSVATIVANAVMPGSGLAAAGRPMLEIVLGVMFAQASLLITGGFANLGFFVPSMVVGAVWGSVHTPYNPLVIASAAPKKPQIPESVIGAEGSPSGPVGSRFGAEGTEPEIEEPGYSVEVRCTECGADVEVPVLARMARCNFCGSHHLVVGHEDTLYVTIPEKARDEAGVRDAVLDHYRYQHYLKLYRSSVAPLEAGATETSSTGQLVTRSEVTAAVAAAERVVAKKADMYRSKLAEKLEIGHAQRFLAPYRHGMGTLFQAAFGRSPQDQEKQLQFAVGIVEASALATRAVDLPPMGKLSYLRALVPAAQCDRSVQALPLDMDETELPDTYGDLDRKRLVRNIDVIRLGSRFSQEVAAVVWRPWWIAEVSGPGVHETLLVDGASASVVGPAPDVRAETLHDLPDEARAPGSGLHFVPMECPTCGHEYPFDTDAVLHFCHNCHRVCSVDSERKREVEYLHQELTVSADLDLVPLWYFPLKIRTSSGELITDLRHFKDGIDGTFDQIGDDLAMRRHGILVPAFRCINPRLMATAYRRMLLHTLQRPPTLTSERFALEEKPTPWSVSLSEPNARMLLPLYLTHVFSRRDLTRVKVHQVAAWLFDASQETPAKLAYVQVPRTVTEPFRAYVGRYRSRAVRHARGTVPTLGKRI